MLFRRIAATVLLFAFSSSTLTWAAPPELQGKLEKGPDGDFHLTQVGTSLDLPWFTLATRHPDGYSKRDFECHSRLWSLWESQGECERFKGDFNSFSIKWGPTISTNTGLQIFALAPLILTGVTVFKTGYFDFKKFAESADRASERANADLLVAKYNDITSYIDSATTSHNLSVERKFSDIHSKYDSLQKNNIRQFVIKPTVVDNTGLWKASNSLPVLKLTERRLPGGYPRLNYTVGRIAASPSDFLTEIAGVRSDFDEKLEEARNNLVLQEAEYDLKLAKLVSTLDLPHQKKYIIDDFTVELNAPEQVEAGRVNTANATYTIKDKTWKGVLPKYLNSDENIEVVVQDGNVRVSNKTDKFLTISSISLYYNSEVYTYTPQSGIELPPETYKRITTDMVTGSNILAESTYKNIDKVKANNTNFTFGMAVKYKLVDRNLERSLYKTKPYNLYKVLQDLV